MKKTTQQFKTKLLSFFTLMSLVLTWLTPIFSNKVLAMTPKFTPTNLKKNTPSKEEIAESMSKMPIQFEENHGQFNKKVRFASRRANETVFLTSTEAVFSQKISEKKSYALKMELLNANKDAKSYGSEEKVSKTNYFRGNDASKWQTDVSTFGRVNYEEVYKGIDLTWYGNADNDLEYDFIVKPNADYQQIRLKFKGAKSLKIADNGDLLIKTKYVTTTQRKPYTYQTINGEKREVASRYELVGKNKVKFVVGEYDKSRELVIDPTLLKYASYLGGSLDEFPTDMVIDNQGNTYITGSTTSSDFPTTFFGYDTSQNGSYDVFVSKISPNGSLLYSTYIGGSLEDRADAIAIDPTGNIYIAGGTFSTNFPTTLSAFDRTFNGGRDAFVLKINNQGTLLDYSTYLGGVDYEREVDIAVAPDGVARVVGLTLSSNFPLFGTGSVNSGYTFYSTFDPTGSSLTFSTKISGTDGQQYGGGVSNGKKITIDSAGNSLILTRTTLDGFPVTADAIDSTFNGGDDVALLKYSPIGTLLYGTYLGGSGSDGSANGSEILFDSQENVWLLVSGSIGFPRTPNSISRATVNLDNFLVKLSPSLGTILFSSPVGDTSRIEATSISMDSADNIYVYGRPFNSFPQYDNCGSAEFIAKIASDGKTVKNFLCMQGAVYDYRQKVIVDNSNNIIVLSRVSDISPRETTRNAADRTIVRDESFISNLKFVSKSTSFDFDADGKSDMAVYRNGIWHVDRSNFNYKAQPFGLATDTPVPADYDGDGKTDFAVWRPSDVSGQPDFYVLKSSTNTLQGVSWGTTTDTPVVADYDGDGRVDFGVYRTTSGDGDFFVLNQTGTSRHYRFGISGDKPVVADYDGDGKADFAVFRPSTQTWYVASSIDNSVQYVSWGLGTDKLVPADYDGDGKTDVAVFRESEGMWYINQSSDGQMKYHQWGLSTDKLVPADYDGDGKTDIAVYRDGQWFIWQSSNNSPNYGNVFGNSSDLPVQTLAVK